MSDSKKSKYDGIFTMIRGTKVEIGDLLEVRAGEDTFWYGEYNGDSKNPSDIIVTYIDKDDDGVYSFQDVSYDAPRDSINNIQSIKNGKKNAWKEFGFVFCGRSEIISMDDVDEEEEDRDWDPDDDVEPSDDDDEDESDDESSDVEEEGDDDISDILDSQDEEDEEESEDSEEVPPPKKSKKVNSFPE